MADLTHVISVLDGQQHVFQVHAVGDRFSIFPSWWDALLGQCWWELRRLRAAGGHLGAVTISA